MKQIYLSLIFCILLVSCGKKELTVEGTVADAQGKLLIFEKAAVSQMSIIDTLTLKKDGKFKFKTPAPVSPEFYILRLDNQIINIIGDSTETIKITTDAKNFASNYTVEGSQETENIKFVIRKASELRRQFVSLNEAYTSKKISAQIFSDSVKSLSDKYKLDVRPYIFENPASGAAYFTLFQKVNGLQMFDPYDKEDYRAFGAVATSWDAHFKESDRAKQLVQITLSALSTRKKAASTDEIPDRKSVV